MVDKNDEKHERWYGKLPPDPRTMSAEVKVSRALEGWQTLWPRAILTLVLAVGFIGVGVVSIFSHVAEISLLERIAAGERVTVAEAASSDDRQAFIAVLSIANFVVLGVVFLFWIWRASKNLDALGASNRMFGALGAVLWWFAPFCNLVQPFRVVREIWEESDSEGSWVGSPVLWVWWIAYLFGAVVALIVEQVSLDAIGIESLITISRLLLMSDVAMVIAALCLIGIVWGITRNQTKRFSLLQAGDVKIVY